MSSTDRSKTLVARGEHPRQSGVSGSGGGNAVTTSPSYETGSHGVLGGGMEPTEGTDFAYGHSTAGDY